MKYLPCLLLLLSTGCNRTPRYQVIAAPVQPDDPKATTFIKLDNQTGQTWKYEREDVKNYPSDSHFDMFSWQPITDNPNEERQRLATTDFTAEWLKERHAHTLKNTVAGDFLPDATNK